MARRATGRWLTLAFIALPCAAAEEPPSLELLLHLAEFSDAAGEPIAPEDAAAMMDTDAPDAPRAEPSPRDRETPSKRAARAAAPEETPHDRD